MFPTFNPFNDRFFLYSLNSSRDISVTSVHSKFFPRKNSWLFFFVFTDATACSSPLYSNPSTLLSSVSDVLSPMMSSAVYLWLSMSLVFWLVFSRIPNPKYQIKTKSRFWFFFSFIWYFEDTFGIFPVDLVFFQSIWYFVRFFGMGERGRALVFPRTRPRFLGR